MEGTRHCNNRAVRYGYIPHRHLKSKQEVINMRVLNESTGRLEERKKSTAEDMLTHVKLCRIAVKKAIKKAQELMK